MTNDEELDADWPIWFTVIDDSVPDDGPLLISPDMPDIADAFVLRLRRMIPLWRKLGVDEDDTGAAYLDGRVWVSIRMLDQGASTSLGHVRVDLTEESWTGSWVTGPSLSTELAHAAPTEQHDHPITDPDTAVTEATDWLEQQLRRPISRRSWYRNGELAASLWQLDDTQRPLIASGDRTLRQDPDTADTITTIRPPERPND